MRYIFCIVLFISFQVSFGQQKDVTVKWTEEEMFVDGKLNEEVWKSADIATDFWQYFPTDTLLSTAQTEVQMAFDQNYLYLGIKVYSRGDNYVVPSLKRDYSARGNDNISLMFDTYRDGSNAFLFGTNPEGVQREALISGGGSVRSDFRATWDVQWENVSKKYKGYYIAEMKIPLASFKFRDQETSWRFTAYRFDTQTNQWSTWANTPQNQLVMSLAFMGNMIFERPLNKVKTKFALIPYLSGNVSQDFDPAKTGTEFSVGGDAKIPIGNSLNLDLTVNPDFSQVEVDELVINLTRFEAFLPEKRQFFIDNADLFSDFGNGRSANPFFSRRIGIAEDLEGNTVENSIVAGARLSGKINNNLRIGFLNIQTAEDVSNEIPTNNNTVLAIQQKVFSRSNIGFIFVNRQVTNMADFVEDAEEFNRVIGLDFNLRSEDNKWSGKYYLHKSFTPESGDKDMSSGGFLEYNSRDWKFNLGSTYVGEDFQSDLGFIRRNDIVTIDPAATRILYPEGSKINTHTFELRGSSTWSPDLDFKYTDGMVDMEYQIAFRNQSRIEMALNHRYTYLLDDFNPTGSDEGVPLPAFSEYNYTKFDFTYESDNRKDFSFTARTDVGEFFNGYKYSLTSDFRFRVQPYFTASFRSSFNYINLPDPYPTESVWFVGPKAEVTFSKNLFWSTFIQFNSLDEDFSINSRLQWRFRPLSDLYVVYNDNYKTTPFSPGYRALIVKFTYWINI